jgi:hypothetical protein
LSPKCAKPPGCFDRTKSVPACRIGKPAGHRSADRRGTLRGGKGNRATRIIAGLTESGADRLRPQEFEPGKHPRAVITIGMPVQPVRPGTGAT